jgi:hypothetical protein
MVQNLRFWKFKDTVGGQSNLENQRENEFSMKVYTTFNGSIDKIIGEM